MFLIQHRMNQRDHLFWPLNSLMVSAGNEMPGHWDPTVPLPLAGFPWVNGNIFKWIKISSRRRSPPPEQIYYRVLGISARSAFVSVTFICILRCLYIYGHNLNLQ